MRLLVVGAGSTGGYFGGRLAQADRDVNFLVRPARAAQLRVRGLIVSPHGDVTLAPKLATAAWNVHDLRRTVATGLQRLGIRLEVTEAVLNHVSGSRAGIAGIYQRHDWASEKRAAPDAWAAHVQAAIEGRIGSGNVVTRAG